MRKLQQQLSNGSWSDCGEQTECFLTLCEKNSNMNREQVLIALETGKKLRNDVEDWYSNCRLAPEPIVRPSVEMVKCNCGCTVPRDSMMNASLGSSCPNCYDRLSG